MIYYLLVILFFLLILLACFINKKCLRKSSLSDLPSDMGESDDELWLRGKVVHVGDGDGFMFFHVPWLRSSEYNGEPTLKIRLAGIDAPEKSQPFFSKAKEALERLVLNKIVNLKLLKKDQYDRILATCYNRGFMGLYNTTNVNTKMVELGMACMYRGWDAVYDDYKNDLLRLQEEASENGIGMWSQNHYVSPMEYKKKHRDRK